MKRSLTFLIMLFSLVLTAQNGKITVHVEDGCSNRFDEPVSIELYNYSVDSTAIIGTSTSNPAEFTGLSPFDFYVVKISSSARHERRVSIKDIYAIHTYILGFHKFNPTTNFVGDVNGFGNISTLDMVLLQRHMIGLDNDQVSDQWIFMDLNSQIPNVAEINRLPGEAAEVTFNAFKHGAVESTFPQYCACTDDPTSTVKLRIPDLDVKAGQSVLFDLIYNGDLLDVGMVFSLKYEDGIIKDVTTDVNKTIYNDDYDKKELNIISNFSNFSSGTKPELSHFKVATINFIPERSGRLLSFFKLNDDFPNEFVYKDNVQVGNQCLKTYKDVVIEAGYTCDVIWPADTTIPTCSNTYFTGEPKVDSACNMFFTFSDEKIGGEKCSVINRKWSAINWATGEFLNHVQVITVDENQTIACYNVSVVMNQNGKATIHAGDLIYKIPYNRKAYSFSLGKPADTLRILDINVLPLTQYFTIYSLTDSTSCVASVTKVRGAGCTDPVNVINEITIRSTGENFNIQGRFFDGGNDIHCLGVISDFQIKSPYNNAFKTSEIFDFFAYKDKSFQLELRYRINGTFQVHGLVKVNLVDESDLYPFELSCYDDHLTQGIEHDIAFFSPTFEHIYAIQGAIRLEDALLVRTREVALKDFATNPDLRSLRFLWVDSEPNTLSDRDTLFVMTILPTADRNVSEIVSMAEDIMRSEAVLDQYRQTKIQLVIRFLKRTSTTNLDVSKDVTIYPNPTTGDFTIESGDIHKGTISLYNEMGQIVYESEQASVNGTFNVSIPEHIQPGVYVVRLQNQQFVSVKKLILMK